MSRIAVIGASSQIAKDLILSFAGDTGNSLLLYVRDARPTIDWVRSHGMHGQCEVLLYETYGEQPHDLVINFVGVGDPQRAAIMGRSIFDITRRFDDIVLDGLKQNPDRKYIFLSSGAAYGSEFLVPAASDTKAVIPLNDLRPTDYYGVAKLHAEATHRSYEEYAITDVRVFNYFSRTQDLDARFFITDIVRSIRNGERLMTSSAPMVRDFLHPSDFRRLFDVILEAGPRNDAVDCYTRDPIDKASLLEEMSVRYGLDYEVTDDPAGVNATGRKPHYYSLNRRAAEYGYAPVHSSISGVVEETDAILGIGS